MSIRMYDAMAHLNGELRHEVADKRIRAMLGEHVVVDSTRALLVWEPRRVVPSYAVPFEDVHATLVSAGWREPQGPPLIHPGIPFTVHSTAGESLSLSAGARTCEEAAFQPADPDLAGYLVLDFDAMDRWYEEDEEVFAHPREPYHRVETRASSRHVRIHHDGRLLADTKRAVLVFETRLPTRFYIPREDIVAELHPTELTTCCPYKGTANYWSTDTHRNIAWTYRHPLAEVAPLAGLVAFYHDIMDVTVDGVVRDRPDTIVAKALLEEFGV